MNNGQTKIAIFGTGGLAKELAMYLKTLGWNPVFIAPPKYHSYIGKSVGNLGMIVATDDLLPIMTIDHYAIGIGNPKIRAALPLGLCSNTPNFNFGARVFDCHFGQGNILTAGVTITVEVMLGNFNYINLHATIGHETTLGDFNVVNPNASISGCVKIGNRCLIGSGATIKEGVTIGDDVTVGMGAVVTKDIPSGQTWVGNPARQMFKVTEGDTTLHSAIKQDVSNFHAGEFWKSDPKDETLPTRPEGFPPVPPEANNDSTE